MALTPLQPEPIVPRNPKPKALTNVIQTEEGQVAAVMANLPSPDGLRKMAAGIAAKAAQDILLGKLTFRSASEASKVARDFAAIAKDLDWHDERAEVIAAETAEDRKDSFESFRKRAQEALKGE